ncbi:MAG: DegV family protein [Bacillota bacterium]
MAEKVRGQQKALRRALDILGEAGRDLKGRIVGISHLARLEEALALKDQVLARFAPREVVVTPMGAAIGTYAGKGGLIIAG